MTRYEFAPGDGMDTFAEERGPEGQGHDLGLEPSCVVHRDADLAQNAIREMARMDGQIVDGDDDAFKELVELMISARPAGWKPEDYEPAEKPTRRSRRYSQRKYRGQPIIVRETPEVAQIL